MKLRSIPYIVAVTCPLALVLAADPLPGTEDPEDAHPNVVEMRRFIASQITDEQAKMIVEKSKKEVESEKARAANEAEKFWQERAERLAKCDEVYSFRHPDECDRSLPLTWTQIGEPMPGFRSVDERIERNLLGICLYVDTVREARKIGCLPPKR